MFASILMPEIEVEIMNWDRTRKASQGPTGEAWLEIASKYTELTSVILMGLP